MAMFDWLRGRKRANGSDDESTRAAVERIVQLSNPRLRFARNYTRRLAPAVRTAMAYARELVARAVPAREGNASTWQAEPCIRCFFATAQDLAAAFSRSPEVRGWFDHNPGAQEICAVLSMELVERRILGVALEGGVLRRDVPQTTVSFTDYRVRICAGTEAELWEDLERRIVDQLALAAIATVTHDESRREALEQERALLRTRLRLLQSKGAGLSGLGLRVNPQLGELGRVQMDLALNEENLRSLAAGSEGLEHQVEKLQLVLGNPAEHFNVASRRIRVDNMNIMLPENSTEPGATLDLQVAKVPIPDGPPELRTFVLVRFRRAELLPRGELLSQAARMLH